MVLASNPIRGASPSSPSTDLGACPVDLRSGSARQPVDSVPESRVRGISPSPQLPSRCSLAHSPDTCSTHTTLLNSLYFSPSFPFSTSSSPSSSSSSAPSSSSSSSPPSSSASGPSSTSSSSHSSSSSSHSSASSSHSSSSSTFFFSRPHSAECRACPVSRAPPNPSPPQLLFSLLPFLWPAALSDRLRVLGSLACLVTAKVLTIQAPLLLASLVDAFQVLPHAASPLSAGVPSALSPGDTSALSPSASGSPDTPVPAERLHDAEKPRTSLGESDGRDEGATARLSPSLETGRPAAASVERTETSGGDSDREDAHALHAASHSLRTEHLGNAASIASVPIGIVCGFPVARIAATGFNELRSTLFARVSQSASCDFSCHAFLHLHSLAFFHDKRAGELSVLISRGIKSVTSLLNVLLFQLVPTVLEFALVLYLLGGKVGGPFACITSLTMAAYVAFTTAVTARRTKIRKAMTAAEQQSVGLLVDSLANAEAVRFFTAEKEELARFAAVQRRYAEKNILVNESLAFLNFGQQFIFNLGVLGSLAYTASQVAAGLLPVGHIVLVSSLLLQLAVPLNFVGTIYRETSLNLADLEKLYELLNHHPPIQNPPNAKQFALQGGALTLDNVSFFYPPSVLRAAPPGAAPRPAGDAQTPPEAARRLLLDGVSFSVAAGEKVAIVGPSGVGKSTLIKLLFRMFDPAKGAVRIDGQDVKELDLHSFRRHIGVVPQDMVLFNDTVEFNIKYGCPNATDDEMRAAAKQAEIDDMIMSMPDGYKTVVGERGLKLSGGERQRIGIARCLLRNPAIAIFDEATSALDSHTEQKILKAFRAMAKGRTTLVIAHRLSTIADANKIIYLKDGRIAEMGTHDELLQNPDGLYRALWESQQHQDKGDARQAWREPTLR
ncbi:Abc transporter, related [Neospora caninum Liverpool]|uniref:Abc transporter, related n=1 Tax=Neospora caninum (strain Liverpool) TaxID=572307 RepID=F0VJP2_NEOCL|nr:Abc transporter, related [Neospora caninum Liverpool]CBZ53953.1 Abc transporter, related [Neospora caninum Liverpool]|eukprot:XP_003883985.1 Abc transporter, related [Neospora caninum Liverpool]